MTVIVPSVEIPTIPDPPEALEVTLLAGAKLVSMPQAINGILSELSHTQSILDQVGPGLAAAQPIFAIVNAVTAVFDFIQAVATANPVGIIESTKKAAEAVEDLAGLVPQVAVPKMVADVLRIVVANLQAIKTLVDEVSAAQQDALDLIASAQSSGNSELAAVGNAMLINATQMQKHLCASLGPMRDLLGILQTLLSLVPGAGPALPAIPDCAGLSVADMLANIETGLADLQDHPLFEREVPEPPPVPTVSTDPKAGIVLAAEFSGVPLFRRVTFSGRFPSAIYTVTATPVTTGSQVYSVDISNKTYDGFDLIVDSDDSSALTEVGWIAYYVGETS